MKKKYLELSNLVYAFEEDEGIPPNMLMTLPLGELDEPITNGRQLLKFISRHINKDRFKTKNRGRGSRKHASGFMKDLTMEQAERVAVYVEEKQSVLDREQRQIERWKDRHALSTIIQELSRKIYSHNLKYPDDISIVQKENEDDKKN